MIKFPQKPAHKPTQKECDFCDHHHSSSLWEELLCHIPYAGFSLACAFALLSILNFIALSSVDPDNIYEGYHVLFHSFHYLHIIVAVTGAMVAFFRFSSNIFVGFLVAVVSPTIFCVLSDIMLPTLAGNLLGVPMHMHICFFNFQDALNLSAFMVLGVICGAALLQHQESLKTFALRSHFLHIFVSSLASLFYIVAHGFSEWHEAMGILFLFLFIAVVVPCTLSDVVVPLYCARGSSK